MSVPSYARSAPTDLVAIRGQHVIASHYLFDPVDVYAKQGLSVFEVPCRVSTGVRAETSKVSLHVRPNPSGGFQEIRFRLDRDMESEVQVVDASGRKVRSLVSGRWAAGLHTVTWDGRDDDGVRAPAGVYFARIEGGSSRGAVRFVRLQ